MEASMKAAVQERLGQPPRYGDFDAPDQREGETTLTVRAAPTARAAPLTLRASTLPSNVAHSARWPRRRRRRSPFRCRMPSTMCKPRRSSIRRWPPGCPSSGARGFTPANACSLGATGASGRMTVRAAQLLGAERVIAAGRNRTVLQSLAADSTIDLTLPAPELKEAFAGEIAHGLDIVVDFVWVSVTEALILALVQPDLHAAAHAGDLRLVEVGAMGGPNIALPGGALAPGRHSRQRHRQLPAARRPSDVRHPRPRRQGRDRRRDGSAAAEVAEAWAAPDDGRRVVLTV
jgi:hypothetical protein